MQPATGTATLGFWQRLLWQLVYPRSRLRAQPTMAGTVLVALSLGLGVAAYNSSNNILFITLSLLIACLVFSGILSWINLRGVEWRLRAEPPWRAGQDGVVALAVTNTKRRLPTYGLWFDLRLVPISGPAQSRRAEGEEVRSRRSVRERLAAAERAVLAGTMQLAGRLDPAETEQLDWIFAPTQRGRWRLELAAVGTSFPFGFLRKSHLLELEREMCVWPASQPYEWLGAGAGWSGVAGTRTRQGGSGVDLLSLRAYAPGDSHRLIHWKASARQRQLLVRQLAAEQQEGYTLGFDPSRDRWPQPEQFELAVRLAATLAEDLFRSGRLRAVVLGREAPLPVRRWADLEAWLDRLAVIVPTETPPPESGGGSLAGGGRRILQLLPDGPHRVAAYLDGRKTATT